MRNVANPDDDVSARDLMWDLMNRVLYTHDRVEETRTRVEETQERMEERLDMLT